MSNRIPRVSIGMPVYNGERFILQALDSILAQDFEDFELIISDNASEDSTYEICQERASQDARIRLHRNETNVGAIRNYNDLVALARGRYFKWAAHDDWCAPQFLSRCVEVMDRDSSVVLSYPKTVLVEEDGSFSEEYHDPMDASSADPGERFLNILWNLNLCNAICGLSRIDTLRQTRLVPSFTGGDKVLLEELALLGRVVEIPEVLFYRRLLGGARLTRGTKWLTGVNRGKSLTKRLRFYYHQLDVVTKSNLSPFQKLRLASNVLGRFTYGSPGRRAISRARGSIAALMLMANQRLRHH